MTLQYRFLEAGVMGGLVFLSLWRILFSLLDPHSRRAWLANVVPEVEVFLESSCFWWSWKNKANWSRLCFVNSDSWILGSYTMFEVTLRILSITFTGVRWQSCIVYSLSIIFLGQKLKRLFPVQNKRQLSFFTIYDEFWHFHSITFRFSSSPALCHLHLALPCLIVARTIDFCIPGRSAWVSDWDQPDHPVVKIFCTVLLKQSHNLFLNIFCFVRSHYFCPLLSLRIF